MLLSYNKKRLAELRYHNAKVEHFDPGIALMLDALALVDLGVEESLRGRKPVCNEGCEHCCKQPIPATPLEILTIRAFLNVYQLAPTKDRQGIDCPFLQENHCIVYPVRPIACRQYLVFNKKCLPSENPTATRMHDVFVPNYTYMHTALRITLPWYRTGWTLPDHCNEESAWTFFKKVTMLLQNISWNHTCCDCAKNNDAMRN
ncbi:MAG: YkgJ family cysteine cluster protein [Desulfovibrionaceae bacterium]|nr:YkgJ family cysteine cluster protein [Desulfovibrionaceae bacterium]